MGTQQILFSIEISVFSFMAVVVAVAIKTTVEVGKPRNIRWKLKEETVEPRNRRKERETAAGIRDKPGEWQIFGAGDVRDKVGAYQRREMRCGDGRSRGSKMLFTFSDIVVLYYHSQSPSV